MLTASQNFSEIELDTVAKKYHKNLTQSLKNYIQYATYKNSENTPHSISHFILE